MICFPNAKINIGLNIIEKRMDGFHNLETIMCPIPLYDVLEYQESESFNIEVFGEGNNDLNENNTIFKVWQKLSEDFQLPAFSIKLLKNIPLQSGLGGGSSDAAFFLKDLNSKYNLGLSIGDLQQISSEIGSDCPFFINNQIAYAESKGEKLSELHLDIKGHYLSIIKPEYGVSTKEAFNRIKPRKPEVNLKNIVETSISNWKNTIVNDFEEFLFSKHTELAEIKNKLYYLGALFVSLSGSGSSIYAISENKLDLRSLEQFIIVGQFKI